MPKKEEKLKKQYSQEDIENLICAAIKVVYPSNQIPWDLENSLVKTRLLFDLRMALKKIK